MCIPLGANPALTALLEQILQPALLNNKCQSHCISLTIICEPLSRGVIGSFDATDAIGVVGVGREFSAPLEACTRRVTS